MKPPNIDLHIDRLVLDGFAHVDRARLGASVEAELGRLFAQQGGASSLGPDGHTPRLDGGTFQAAPGAGADALGRQIAQRVYRGVHR